MLQWPATRPAAASALPSPNPPPPTHSAEIKSLVSSWDRHAVVAAPPTMDPLTAFAAQMADDTSFLSWARGATGHAAISAELTKVGRAWGQGSGITVCLGARNQL